MEFSCIEKYDITVYGVSETDTDFSPALAIGLSLNFTHKL